MISPIPANKESLHIYFRLSFPGGAITWQHLRPSVAQSPQPQGGRELCSIHLTIEKNCTLLAQEDIVSATSKAKYGGLNSSSRWLIAAPLNPPTKHDAAARTVSAPRARLLLRRGHRRRNTITTLHLFSLDCCFWGWLPGVRVGLVGHPDKRRRESPQRRPSRGQQREPTILRRPRSTRRRAAGRGMALVAREISTVRHAADGDGLVRGSRGG